MKHIVSFSGGRTSAYLVYKMQEMHKAGKIEQPIYIFMDTGAEHPDTYRFIKDVVADTGIDLICLRAKITKVGAGVGYRRVNINQIGGDLQPWRDMLRVYGTPTLVMPACTRIMKTDPFNAYIKEHVTGAHTVWLGIRADEPRRIKEKEGIKYLAEISDFDKKDVIDWWSNKAHDLRISEHLGNCVFCVKKGTNKIAMAAQDAPDEATEFLKIIESPEVRVRGSQKEGGYDHRAMYRGNTTLSGIIDMYKDIPRHLLEKRSYKQNACSESCEAVNLQLDL